MKKVSRFFTFVLTAIFAVGLFAACENGNGGGTGTDGKAKFSGITFESRTFDYDGTEKELLVKGSLPQGASVNYTGNTATAPGTYRATATLSAEGYETATLNATWKINPTGTFFVNAAKMSSDENVHEYDFSFNIKGAANLMGFGGEVNGNYDAHYRYDKAADLLTFRRTTSGVLFYDSTKYISDDGETYLAVTQDENNLVKNISVESSDGEFLINREIENVLYSLKAENVANIGFSEEAGYQYQFNIDANSQNVLLGKLLGIIKSAGTNININSIKLTNPANGIKFYFNTDSTLALSDFKLGLEITVPIKLVETQLSVSYTQTKKSANITFPDVSGLITAKSDIATDMSEIRSAVAAVKNSEAYSLDLTASNEFDPGVLVWATTDSYTARMYKNGTDFNKSYQFKTHHEEDGKESYTYTVGNIQDGTVYTVSRKGKNTYTPTSGITAESSFDSLTGLLLPAAENVTCIRKETSAAKTVYYLYLDKQSTVSISDSVCALLNTNDAEGVVKVDNYFNRADYTIESADLVVEITNGVLSKISVETNIKYVPTGGEYTDRYIKLTDQLELTVNANLAAAQKYAAPEKAEPNLIGIGGLKNIL